MLWKKKKGMIDIREMQKKGRIRIPKSQKEVNADSEGFVSVGNQEVSNQDIVNKKESSSMLSFMDPDSNNFSNSGEGYSKKEIDQRIEAMDNKIYKLEQKIELLEKKAGIGSGSPIGW